jgi:hypothetical protein
MHQLKTAYTGYFNRRHRLVGHLFQGRLAVSVGSPASIAGGWKNPWLMGSKIRLKRYSGSTSWEEKISCVDSSTIGTKKNEPPKDYGRKREWSVPHRAADILEWVSKHFKSDIETLKVRGKRNEVGRPSPRD